MYTFSKVSIESISLVVFLLVKLDWAWNSWLLGGDCFNRFLKQGSGFCWKSNSTLWKQWKNWGATDFCCYHCQRIKRDPTHLLKVNKIIFDQKKRSKKMQLISKTKILKNFVDFFGSQTKCQNCLYQPLEIMFRWHKWCHYSNLLDKNQ